MLWIIIGVYVLAILAVGCGFLAVILMCYEIKDDVVFVWLKGDEWRLLLLTIFWPLSALLFIRTLIVEWPTVVKITKEGLI